MSVVVECSVPAAGFELGRALRDAEFTSAELERLIAIGSHGDAGTIAPFLRTLDANAAALEATLRDAEGIDHARLLDAFDDRALFGVEWTPADGGFLHTLSGLDVAISEAVGSGDRWRFRLRFHTDEALSAFRKYRREGETGIDLRRVADLADWETAEPAEAMKLTPAQHEALVTAFEEGYFAVPRRTNLVSLSEQLGISGQSLSERLRRGEGKLLATSLVAKPEPEPE